MYLIFFLMISSPAGPAMGCMMPNAKKQIGTKCANSLPHRSFNIAQEKVRGFQLLKMLGGALDCQLNLSFLTRIHGEWISKQFYCTLLIQSNFWVTLFTFIFFTWNVCCIKLFKKKKKEKRKKKIYNHHDLAPLLQTVS